MIDMIRKIIQIDEEKCNGCGLCASACHEGAIGMVNGKAKLLRDDYCDGLGDCLPACPTNAITFTEREAAPYDKAAVEAHMKARKEAQNAALSGGCPGSKARSLRPAADSAAKSNPASCAGAAPSLASAAKNTQTASELMQWPVQIKLAPLVAPYFENASLLIAADCTAYAYASFHRDFIKGRITLIGCPKLDSVDYAEKLTEILRQNDIRDVTIVRMEVPCCGGIEMAAKTALKNSGKFLPSQTITISTDGKIL